MSSKGDREANGEKKGEAVITCMQVSQEYCDAEGKEVHTTTSALAMTFSWGRKKRRGQLVEGAQSPHWHFSLPHNLTSLASHCWETGSLKKRFYQAQQGGKKSNTKPRQTSMSLGLLLSPLFLLFPFPSCFYHILFCLTFFPYPFLPLLILFPMFSSRHCALFTGPQKHPVPSNSTFKLVAAVFQWPVRGTLASLLCHQTALCHITSSIQPLAPPAPLSLGDPSPWSRERRRSCPHCRVASHLGVMLFRKHYQELPLTASDTEWYLVPSSSRIKPLQMTDVQATDAQALLHLTPGSHQEA